MSQTDSAQRELRLGFDVDGVLALFERGFERMCAAVTGKNLFPWEPGSGVTDPPCWDWPQHFGYTNEEVGRVWDAIKADPQFWENLDPGDGADDLWVMMPFIEQRHAVYFVTARVGMNVKQQTENFLRFHCAAKNPTVLISKEKGAVAKALKLDAYIDDNADNVNDVMAKTEGSTAVYLLDRAYNRPPACAPIDMRVRRISQLRDMLIAFGIRP